MPAQAATHAQPVPAAVTAAPRTSLFTSAGALLAAKMVFVIAGYALYAGLSRLLSPAQFGTFLIVNSTVAVLNAVFVSGTIQAVSRFVSQAPDHAGGTLRTALRLQASLAGVLGGVYFLSAPLIASLLNDPSLTPFLRVSAVIPVAYALYAAMIGYANGLGRFVQQAGFDVAFSVLKITLVTALPWLGYGAFGAVAGFAAASVVIMAAAWLLIGRHAMRDRAPGTTSASAILRFEAAVMGHVALANLLMQLDLLMVKSLYPVADASTAAGLYGAAAKLAQIPYSVLVALNFLIFPYIARLTAHSPKEESARYIRQALRLCCALTVGPAIVLAAVSPNAVALVFGPAYTSAAPVLTVLACGYVAFSLLTMMSTVINGSGRPLVSLCVAGGTVVAQLLLARVLIPADGILGGAVASSIAYALGLVAATIYVTVRFGSVMPWVSLARIVAAALVVVGTSQALPGSTSVLLAAPLLGCLYLLTLFVLKEWTSTELKYAAGRASGAS